MPLYKNEKCYTIFNRNEKKMTRDVQTKQYLQQRKKRTASTRRLNY